jgi:hypothetical protein
MHFTKTQLQVSPREDLILILDEVNSQLKRKNAQISTARNKLSRTRLQVSKMRELIILHRKQILDLYQKQEL